MRLVAEAAEAPFNRHLRLHLSQFGALNSQNQTYLLAQFDYCTYFKVYGNNVDRTARSTER